MVIDDNGNAVDPMAPSITTILTLLNNPELTHKGEWAAWLGGLLLCAATAFTILFADELFRWQLSFRIQDADRAEPNDWEMVGRYATWTVFPIIALVIFIWGLV